MKYFIEEECTRSDTAKAKGIDNTPSAEHKAHIKESIETLIDPLREVWELHCKAVGGSSTSAHCHGYAFDLVPVNGKMMEFKRFCRNFLADKAFDQLISEGEDKLGVPAWMHVGYKHPDGVRQRHQYRSMIDGKYYPMTK